jgi:hypothetical protein
MNRRRGGPAPNRTLAALTVVFFISMFLVGSAANADVGVRQGRHGDMGRLVFDFAGIEAIHTHRAGDMLTIQFTPAQPIASVPINIPGVLAMQGGNGSVQLQLSAGAVPHVFRIGDRVVVDATATAPRPAGRAKPVPAALPAAKAAPPSPAAPPAKATPPLPAAPPSQPAAALPAPTNPQASLPAASPPAANLPAASPPAASLPTASLPQPVMVNFTSQPGAAACRRGNDAVLVFDTAEIPDISALQSTPAYANATLVSLQDAQIITMPLPASESLNLSPNAGGWQVAAVPATPFGRAPLAAQNAKIEFPMPAADKAVTISDPLTGGDLLVGTVTQANAAADSAEYGPGFSILPCWLGVAVLPQADTLGLNNTETGFELSSSAPGGLPLGVLPASAADAGSVAEAAPYGQGLNLPSGDTASLRRRMISDLRAAATAAPLGRLTPQIDLASDMIALGLGPEAKGVLLTAVLENPAAQDNGRIAGLQAVAGVLARKYNPADFTAPGIDAGSELDFWKAVGEMQQGNTLQAAPALAANLAMFEAYPEALRNSIGPELAEALVDAGQLQAAQNLVDADPANPALDLARAKLLERQSPSAALAAYQRLASNRDMRVSAIAQDRATELLLAAGRLSPAQAADRLDAALFDWRDPEHERHMRLRVAQLRARAGQWPQAFTMLQSARSRFPAYQSQIDAARAGLFLKMLASNQFAAMPPIQAVAILEQNQDLIPASGSANVINLLAQRLDELDLPGAAAPMLSHLIQTIPPGTARATLGARLAQVDWDAGSPVATLADLAQTQADNLPAALAAQRAILHDKAEAAAGNAVAAVANLGSSPAPPATPAAGTPAAGTPDPDPAALQTQAQIAEQSGQWPQAEQALNALVNQTVPAAGPITGDPENLLLRLATAASHNNDTATLAALASQYASRVGNDAAGQMFQTLTAPSVTGDQGLNQALKEISQLQALPAMVDAVTLPPRGARAPSGTP